VAALLLSTSHLLADRLLVRGVEEQHPETLTLAAALSLEPGRAQRHQGWLLVEAGRPREALPLVQSALGRSPDPTAWVLLGRTWMALGELERAREAFAQAVWLHPGLFAGHFNLARACEDLGRRHEARRHAQRARSLHPGDPRLRWLPQ
jgi:tetratricopeptide (TPR) repeat protein